MALKDHFPSAEERQNATDVLKKFEGRKKLNEPQQLAVEKAQTVLKRHQSTRRKLGIGGFILAVAGVGAYTYLDRKEPQDPAKDEVTVSTSSARNSAAPHQKAEKVAQTEEDNEPAVEEAITAIETGMENLRKALLPKVEAVQNPDLKKKIMSAFELMAINQKNPNKNNVVVKRKMHEAQSFDAGTSVLKQENINYFSYGVGKNESSIASYIPISRTMMLNEKIAAKNMLDMAVVAHELRHVMQDTGVRANISSEQEFIAYQRAYALAPGEKMAVFILEEATAYAYEIETINLLLDGAMKKSALENRPLNTDDALKKLNARPDQNGLLELLQEFANAYYRSGSTLDGLRKSYIDAIADKYDPRQWEIYQQFTLSGRPIKYQR